MSSSITYTAALGITRETVEHLARLLAAHRRHLGTRRGTRGLGTFKQAVLVLRWFVDATRVRDLAGDNRIGLSTAYAYLHEGIDVLADRAPDLHTAVEQARAAGGAHLNLDGTVIRTDRVATPGPNGPICGGRESTSTTAVTSRSSPAPAGGRCGPRTCGRGASTIPPAPRQRRG